MAGPTTSVKNAMLDNAFPSGSASLSLHSGDPGETGLNELSGGAPAYARKTVTLTAASAGTKTYSTGVVTFDVAAGGTAAYVSADHPVKLRGDNRVIRLGLSNRYCAREPVRIAEDAPHRAGSQLVDKSHDIAVCNA